MHTGSENTGQTLSEDGTPTNADGALHLYKMLQQGKSREIKAEANRKICEFIDTQQAWVVAGQLLVPERQADEQFIGAQIIIQKLESQFDVIEAKDAQVIEIRDNLFQMLIRIATPPNDQTTDQSQTLIPVAKKAPIERLCRAIALIALKTHLSCWSDSITEIIAFGSTNFLQCQLSLSILKNICEVFESGELTGLRKGHRGQVEFFLRENLDNVLSFINQILRNQNLKTDCQLEALRAAKEWCNFSKDTLVPNELFIQAIFQLIETSRPLFSKAMTILKKLLVVSRYAKALEHMSMKEAFTAMPDKDKTLLQSLVVFMTRNRDNFVSECQKPFSEDDEDDFPYARKFCSLVTVLCSNYELLLVQQTQEQASLFRLLKDCAQSTNQRIAVQSLNFWEEFNETITTRLQLEQNLSSYEHLFTEFREIAQIMLVASAKLPSISYHELDRAEIEELEANERGVSLRIFRDHSSEILLKAYYLFVRYYGDSGAETILQIILQALQDGDSDPIRAEVCFFAARSIYDAFPETQTQEPKVTLFVTRLVEFIVTNQQSLQSFIVAQQILLFIDLSAKLLTEFKQYHSQLLQYMLSVYQTQPKLRTLALKAIYELSAHCKYSFTVADVNLLHQFLTQHYAEMSVAHASLLMETIAQSMSILSEGSQLKTSLEQVTAIPIKVLTEANGETLAMEILKATAVLGRCVKSVSDLPVFVLEEALQGLFEKVWPPLSKVLKDRPFEYEVVTFICTLVGEVFKALGSQLLNYHTMVETQLLETFDRSQNNVVCLQKVADLIEIMGKTDSATSNRATQSVDQFISMILPKVVKPAKPNQQETFVERIDSSVVTAFANLLTKIVYLDPAAYANSNHFDQSVDLLCEVMGTVSEKSAQNAILNLFLMVTQSLQTRLAPQPQLQQKVLAKYDRIIRALMGAAALHREGRSGLQKVQECFITILNQADALGQLESMKRSLMASFDDIEGLRQASHQLKQIFVYVVITLRAEPHKVKLALIVLNANITGQQGVDGFIGLELSAKEKEKQLSNPNPVTIEIS